MSSSQCDIEECDRAELVLPLSLVRASSRRSVDIPLDARVGCILGSAATGDIVLEDAGISPRHARLVRRDGALTVEPLDGALVSVNGKTVQKSTVLCPGDWLALGQTLFQVNLQGAPAIRPAAEVQSARDTGARATADSHSIGRLPDSDLRIDSPIISRRHALIRRVSGQYVIRDLDSTNGTYVNGRRVLGQAPLADGDQVQFGSFAYSFSGGCLSPLADAGRIRLEARGIGKTVTDASSGAARHLLTEINLAIRPGEFVGIFGTSGSGKSTLLDTLNGRRPATQGQVLYNGTDLYRSFDLFKSTIGYVPQQDIVHRKITIRNALAYTARLRLPEDTATSEIDQHIERVLARVGLLDKISQPIDTPAPLSGGQLKRVSLAIELVSNPSVLFLDEATSGLDAGTDKRMMRLFADLASDGKTIVCVTHTLENIDACDLVVVLCSGYLAFVGPPEAMLVHFEIERASDVYDRLESATPSKWAAAFAQSPLYREYVTDRLASAPAERSTVNDPAADTERRAARWIDLRQLRILTRRYLDLMMSDRRNLLFLLAQAPLIGLAVGRAFRPAIDEATSTIARAGAESTVLVLTVISMIWFGTINACREIVKELPIYMRERAVNLGIGSYLLSKLLPLTALCGYQCVALLAGIAAFVTLPGAFEWQALALFMTGVSATAMGLFVSASVSSPDKALTLAPMLLIPQVVLAHAFVKLEGATEVIAKVFMVSFWGNDAMKATLPEDARAALQYGVLGTYWGDLAALLLFTLFFFAASTVALKRKDR